MLAQNSDSRLPPLLDVLRRAAEFLESLHGEAITADPVRLHHEVAALSLIRGGRLVQALVLLFENGHAFAAEPALRTLLEVAFNLAWVGADEERATSFRDDGIARAEAWISALRDEYGVKFSAPLEEWLRGFLGQRSPGKKKTFPLPRDRAKQVSVRGKRFAISGMPRSYRAYQRLSAAVHADYWHLAANPEKEEAHLVVDAQDAIAATSFLIIVGAETLGFDEKAVTIVRDLRGAAAASFERIKE